MVDDPAKRDGRSAAEGLLSGGSGGAGGIAGGGNFEGNAGGTWGGGEADSTVLAVGSAGSTTHAVGMDRGAHRRRIAAGSIGSRRDIVADGGGSRRTPGCDGEQSGFRGVPAERS